MKKTHSRAKNALKRILPLMLCGCMAFGFAGCELVEGFTGPAGPAGPAGPQGAQGIQGPAGPAGQNGLDGKDANTGDLYSASADITESTLNPLGTISGNLAAKGQFYADYRTREEAHAAGEKLNTEIAAEGFVLLKNKNNALPLDKSEVDVTLFGARSVDLQLSGGGSGANDGSKREYTLLESMEAAGYYDINALINKYLTNEDGGDL